MSGRVRRIAMQALTHCDVCCSGRHLEIGFTDHRGEPALIYVPQESLRRLLLALPAAAAEAGTTSAGLGRDAILPLADWQLRQDGEAQSLVLTLRRVDGLGVCYQLPAAAAAALAAALREAAAPQDATAARRARLAGLRQ
jgi:hypothetical protein